MEYPVHFKMINFRPRVGVTSRINYLLELLLDRVPPNCVCKAQIVRAGEKFNFEITMKTDIETFQSKFDVDVNDNRCKPRLWQIDVIAEMAREIDAQIRSWHSRRFAA